ncbi:hypothetical protein GGI21_006529, partial [Coemansia aciculifera]
RGVDYVNHYRDAARDAAIEYNKSFGSAGGSGKAKGAVRFAWVDGNKWASYVDRVFRIRHDNWPAIVIARPSEDQFFTTDVKGAPIEPSKKGVLLAVRAVLDGKLKAQSTNSIIVRGAHGLVWAVKSVWALLFGTILRVFVTVTGLCGVVYYLRKRNKQTEAHTLVKGD